MRFEGETELENVSRDDVWLALSDPYMIKQCLPGCQFIVEVDADDDVDFEAIREDEPEEDPDILPDADPKTVEERGLTESGTYAALIEIGVGSVKPSFESIVTIETKEFPEMTASGKGNAADSSFEMNSGMTLVETEDGVTIEWWAEADIYGRIAQMGQRMINPVANRVTNKFFSQFEAQLSDFERTESPGLLDRIRALVDRLLRRFGRGSASSSD